MSLKYTFLKRKNSKGFTLLEALIGFFILSVGMLGIASLQTISLKTGKSSIYGSVAMIKADELFESMRVNPQSLATYTGAGVDNGCGGTKNCTAAELAADDVFWWSKNLKADLPSTVTSLVTVTAEVAPSKMATVLITINWNERDKGSSGSVSKSFATTTNICTAIPC